MKTLWVVVAIGITAALGKWMTWAHGRAGPSRLGFVSHQWLEEHRLSQISDPQR